MRRSRETVVVIGEGITEKYYIQSLRDVLVIKPTAIKPKNSSLEELEHSIEGAIKEGYSRIYCLIDKDNMVLDGNPDHERNAKVYSNLRNKYHNKRIKNRDGDESYVCMIESFPATEIFFHYYFGFRGAYFSNSQLKNILNERVGYKTEEKYLIKNSLNEVLTRVGGSLECAVEASVLSIRNNPDKNTNSSFTEIGFMIKALLSGVFE